MRRFLTTALVVACGFGIHAAGAEAYDNYPCAESTGTIGGQPGQRCPLSGLFQGDLLPLYTSPVRHARAKDPLPAPRQNLKANNGSLGKEFVFICHQPFPGGAAFFVHPGGWNNHWWAKTIGTDGKEGWVSEVFFKGGGNHEPDLGLRRCPKPPPPPPPPGPCQPLPRSTAADLAVSFRSGRKAISTRFGAHPRVFGALVSASGPMAGTAVCVGTQDRSDGPVRQTGSVTTDADGRFTYTVPTGPSRRLCFVRRVTAGAAADCVDVRVRARVSMSSSRRSLTNGQRTVFKGRLRGRGARGTVVELQYPQRGGWQTFATVHAGKGGRYRYRYRFTRTFGTRVYKLRARVPAQRGYPYVTGSSRRVKVVVSG